ncbi:zinc finger protein 37-like [Macrobrachium nipponense]|uniref:zinc finger protein 37-like n=1 Tax=Macrobrachium nipponense TaxID=159736 RepID=UPI0030C7AA8E
MLSFRDLVESMESGLRENRLECDEFSKRETINFETLKKLKVENQADDVSSPALPVKEEPHEVNASICKEDHVSDEDYSPMHKHIHRENSADISNVTQSQLGGLRCQLTKSERGLTNEMVRNLGQRKGHCENCLKIVEYKSTLDAAPVPGSYPRCSVSPCEHIPNDSCVQSSGPNRGHQVSAQSNALDELLSEDVRMVRKSRDANGPSANLFGKCELEIENDVSASKTDCHRFPLTSDPRETSSVKLSAVCEGGDGMRTTWEANTGIRTSTECRRVRVTTPEHTELLRCDFCDATFRSKAQLENHEKFHSPIRPFQCPECPRRFNQLSHLNIHKRTHSGERPFECPTCGARFSRKDRLRSHLRVHTGEKPYACPRCSRLFKYSWDLKDHLKTKHPSQGLFQCRICHVSFANLTTFTSHWETHR